MSDRPNIAGGIANRCGCGSRLELSPSGSGVVCTRCEKDYWRMQRGDPTTTEAKLQQRIEELEGALGDIYPVLAGRCIRLQEEGEERAAATWDGYCRRIAAALNQTEEADHE